MFSFLGDIVLLLHFAYVIFALAGGLLLIWRPKIIWLHLPAALWAALIMFAGWVCPLTYLENRLRFHSGKTGYSQSFIAEYIEPVLYPVGLTHFHQVSLGVIVVGLNLAIYGYVFKPKTGTNRS